MAMRYYFIQNAAGRFLGCIVSLLVLCPLAHAQKLENSGKVPTAPAFLRRPINLSGKDISFAAVLQRIGRQGKIFMVCDGIPGIKQTDFESAGTLEEALNKLGELYDLEWTATKTNAITLRKRFRKQEEYAQVSRTEMLRTSDDVLNVLDALKLNSEAVQKFPLTDIYFQLSAEQKHHLELGKRLPITTISPFLQQQLSQLVVARTFFGTLILWQSMKQLLHNLPSATVTLRTVQRVEEKEPHYDLLMEWRPRGKGKVTRTLSSISQTEFTALLDQAKQETLVPRVPSAETQSPTSRKEGNPPSLAIPIQSNGSPQSLSQLAGRLSEATGYRIYVAEPLRERRICLASASQTAKEILSTVCSLLDLKWQKTRPDELEIVLPRRDAPRNAQEAALLISKAMPTEWRTMFGNQIAPNEIQERFPEGKEASFSSLGVLDISNNQRGEKVIENSHIELVRYLIAAKKVDKNIAFGQLNAQAKDALTRAIVYRTIFGGGMIDYSLYHGKLPNHVAHFDKAYLELRTEDNQRGPSFEQTAPQKEKPINRKMFYIMADGAGDGTTYLGWGKPIETP